MVPVFRLFYLCCFACTAAATIDAIDPLEISAQALVTYNTVVVDVDASTKTPFDYYWKRTFGSGHAKLTLRPDWQQHAAQAVKELGMQGVRYHGLYDDDMTVVVPAAAGAYTFNFTALGQSWDYQKSIGLTPIVELSFMPALLANCSWGNLNKGKPACKTMMAYRGIQQPPVKMSDWSALVKATAEFAIKRYGLDTVRTWSFEVIRSSISIFRLIPVS